MMRVLKRHRFRMLLQFFPNPALYLMNNDVACDSLPLFSFLFYFILFFSWQLHCFMQWNIMATMCP
uniref:Uncharacterized protein n=1 Tax=Rhizophora mucronata TaxID=61149 RepID=A0A2P2QDQ0_RHIMU